MRCATHDQDAIAVCSYCGRALCPACEPASSSRRMACSRACADALADSTRAIELTLGKSVQTAKATAFGSYALGVLCIAFAIYGHHVYPQMRVGNPLLAAFGVISLVWGFWFQRVGRKN